MNDAIVFSGPTILPTEVRSFLPGADCQGPAERGDVLRACQSRPVVICIIDGYFEHRPAVTHKEILWAIKQGIRVYGAASMGALRAAELDRYGMVGVGAVFRSFASGVLEGEDEVAVPHAEGPTFRRGGDALVNIRATLEAAANAGVIDDDSRCTLLGVAKDMFYAERNYPALLERCEQRLPPEMLESLRGWLTVPSHRIDRKRLDAEELLVHVRERLPSGQLDHRATDWAFPATATFRQLHDEVMTTRQGQGRAQPMAPLLEAMLEEVKLLGPRSYEYVLARAAFRELCSTEVRGAKRRAPDGTARESTSAPGEAELDAALPRVLARLSRSLPEVLRSMGDDARVRERAKLKRELLQGVTLTVPTREVLRTFWRRIDEPEPSSLREAAAVLGFASEEALLRAVAREEAFLRCLENA